MDINKEVLSRTAQIIQQLPDIIEAVPAYSSLAVYFDVPRWRKKTPGDKLVFDHLRDIIHELLTRPTEWQESTGRLIEVPVCYDPEFAGDAGAIAAANNITVAQVIEWHHSRIYRVYMLGFLPGFCYLGETDERIAMPRKLKPVTVAAGSVGIAGRQTGIYPLASPGGWQVIGRTPLSLFNGKGDEPTLVKAGDNIRFFPITTETFFQIHTSTDPIQATTVT